MLAFIIRLFRSLLSHDRQDKCPDWCDIPFTHHHVTK